jgi:hypothetical protein
LSIDTFKRKAAGMLSHRTRWKTTLACGACVIAGAPLVAAAPPASASRAPSAGERAQIVSAIESSEETAAVRGRFDVRALQISTVRTPSVRWGRARIVPKPGVQADGATVIVGRFGRAWKVVDLGTGGVGCWLEARVRRDLRIVGC